MNLKSFLLQIIIIFIIGGQLSAQNNYKKTESKFVYLTSVGFSTGVGEIKYEEKKLKNTIPIIRVHQVLAYQFNNYFTLGLGAGLDAWKNTAFIPLYLNLNVNFLDKKTTPLWHLHTGYSFKWYESQKPEDGTRVIHGAKTGLYGETGLGVNIKFLQKVSFLITVNYTVQESQLKYSVINPNEEDFSKYSTNRSKNVLYHFIGIKLGILY